ncbi:MAG: hypothetical protein SH868_05270 [Bythopirellula sp.]|nr:hypothetical protein [Bythopirellula sp.]
MRKSLTIALTFAACQIFQSASAVAGAFNFQSPTDWTVGGTGSTYQEWEASEATPFASVNTLPTASITSPTITSLAKMSVQSPGFVASSGGYYSFSETIPTYRIFANVYNHAGSFGTGGPYANNHGTRVIVQTAATMNPDYAASVFQNSVELVKIDGTALAGGANTDLLSVTQLFLGEVETSFGLADQQELRLEFFLPSYAADFRVRFQSSVHSSFQELRVDTLLVSEEVAIPGDFDGDTDVDTDDLADWQASYSFNGLGDADADGDSDGRDLLIWQRNYTGAEALTSFSIPEPTSPALVIFGILNILSYRRTYPGATR